MSYNKYPISFRTYEKFHEIFNSIPDDKDRRIWVESLDPKLLGVRQSNGWTVAHMLASVKIFPEGWITKELLRMKSNRGRTVAHELAENGILPQKWMTERVLRMKDNRGITVAHEIVRSGALPEKQILFPDRGVAKQIFRMKNMYGSTVAGYHYVFLFNNSRWDLLVPALLDVPSKDKVLIADLVASDLSEMKAPDLEKTLSLMPEKTRIRLLSFVKDPALVKKIRTHLDREMEMNVFETPSEAPDTSPVEKNNDCPPLFAEQDLCSDGREDLYEAGCDR